MLQHLIPWIFANVHTPDNSTSCIDMPCASDRRLLLGSPLAAHGSRPGYVAWIKAMWPSPANREPIALCPWFKLTPPALSFHPHQISIRKVAKHNNTLFRNPFRTTCADAPWHEKLALLNCGFIIHHSVICKQMLAIDFQEETARLFPQYTRPKAPVP